MFIRYLGQYKETNSPFSYLSFGSTILHLGHLQFYIVAISASGQERLYTAIVMALLWLWSSKDFDFGVRCLIQSYICVTPDLCDQIKNAKLSAMQSTRSQVDNKLGENVFFCLFFSWLFFLYLGLEIDIWEWRRWSCSCKKIHAYHILFFSHIMWFVPSLCCSSWISTPSWLQWS